MKLVKVCRFKHMRNLYMLYCNNNLPPDSVLDCYLETMFQIFLQKKLHPLSEYLLHSSSLHFPAISKSSIIINIFSKFLNSKHIPNFIHSMSYTVVMYHIAVSNLYYFLQCALLSCHATHFPFTELSFHCKSKNSSFKPYYSQMASITYKKHSCHFSRQTQ